MTFFCRKVVLIETPEIEDKKFSSAGYGEFRAVADNEKAEGRAANRRVEFSVALKEEANKKAVGF